MRTLLSDHSLISSTALLGKHSNCGAGAYLLQNLWDPSSLAWDRTHIPALQGGLSTTGPKGESLPHVLL